MMVNSEAERVANLKPDAYRRWAKGIKFDALEYDWTFWRRDDQKPPEGDWRTWLVMAGRGFGKTRMGAEWVRNLAEADGSLRIALIAATMAEARAIMVEGESGLLSIAPDEQRPDWEPSLRRLSWKSGAIATLYSAAEPDSLRGPEHHLAWGDEIAKWDRGDAVFDTLAMSMRLGRAPRTLMTTTPRPVPILRRLISEAGIAITRGAMDANAMHLPFAFRDAMRRTYGGTRLGRQELDGELIEQIEDALWSQAMIEACRVATAPALDRIVIAVDPPAGTDGDACGIIAAGVDGEGHAYVLGDHSVSGRSPEGWARAVAAAALVWGADRVIAEANNGGAMVESTLRAADCAMPVRLVHASRGKVARAEPVAALYEAGRAHHAGVFPQLEDELCGLGTGGRYLGPGRSPDRADALVWAMTELMLKRGGVEARVRAM